MNDNELWARVTKWICIVLISIIAGVTIYNTAVDIRWEPKMEQRYVHPHSN